ncbi:MAG TPA: hypothetical protein VLE96_01080 [Chlamydiales bacterium]|nr:hypothetical protein [Chlamydiales bacterium]
MNSSETPDVTHIQQEPEVVTNVEERVDKGEEGELKRSAAFVEFSKKLTQFPTPEEKISFGLNFMRETISQEGSPRFREFWESRRLVLPLFKENINTAIRSKLWNEYVDLTVEARRLKEILEEQSAFAIEQIDLAIQSIDQDLSNFETLLAQSSDLNFNEAPQSIQSKISTYQQLQKELNLLNALASRLNGLRKEIIKTDMRIRFKTKFFKRLSELGDRIFPRRKALIEQVSLEFEKDVERFVTKHFKGDEIVGAPYYALREEIKSFQWTAKILTLSSPVFSRTRLRMSECWDKVKTLEKEHKKVLLEKKLASSESCQAIFAKIEELKARSESMPLRDLDKETDQILAEMRTIYLDRDDVRSMRDALSQLRIPHLAAQEKKAKDLEEAEKEKLRLRKEKLAQTKEQIADLVQKGLALDLDTFVSQFKAIEADMATMDLSKMERQQLDRQLRPLKDMIADKKENSLMNLSDDDRKMLENYRLVLQQKKARRQEIKELVDSYRKTLGSSGLDFEKAFQLRELLDVEKERLDKANAAIEEIEQKIAKL